MFKIIAETAFSHEGDFSYLLNQIDVAAKSKADYIKFQVFINKDEYIVPNHPAYKVLDNWIFKKKQWLKAFDYASKKSLRILALPLTVSSLELCIEYEGTIELIEIHSICFNDTNLINLIKSINNKIVLGIGGRTVQEVETLINKLQRTSSDFILMYGFQSFPTEKSKLNLRKIENFKKKFNMTMAYADHSTFKNQNYIELITSAYILGSEFFEKHVVLIKGEERTDFESAIVADDFLLMRAKLEELESVLGYGDTSLLNEKELIYQSREKQMVYEKNLQKGDILKDDDISYKISESLSDLSFKSTGKVLKVDVNKNQSVKKIHFS